MIILQEFDLNKSLDDLEGITFGEPNFQSSLVKKCHEIREKKLKDFTTEDLRLMIGQGISLNYLIPLALDKLEANPFVGGDLFMADLLEQVLKVDIEFWKSNMDLHYRFDEIMTMVKSLIESLTPLIKNYKSPL